MTPACPYLAAVWKGVSPYCNTEDNSTVSRWVRTHVILHVRPAAVEKENPTGLIVATLTAQVESCEAAPVLHVHVGLGLAQAAHCPAEPLPGGLVEGRVAVELVLVVQAGALLHQNLRHLEVASSCSSLQGRVPGLGIFQSETNNNKQQIITNNKQTYKVLHVGIATPV